MSEHLPEDSPWSSRRPPPVSTTPLESEESLQPVSPQSAESNGGPQSFFPFPVYHELPFTFHPPFAFPFMAGPFFVADANHVQHHAAPSEAPKPVKRVIAIKDPKTGRALDLSEVKKSVKVSPEVEDLANGEPSPKAAAPAQAAHLAPAATASAASEGAASERGTTLKSLPLIKNKPLVLPPALPLTAAHLRMLDRRIFNKPLQDSPTASTVSATYVAEAVYVPLPTTNVSKAPVAPPPRVVSPTSKPAAASAAASAIPAKAVLTPAAPTGGPGEAIVYSRAALLALMPRRRPAAPAELAFTVTRSAGAAASKGGRAEGGAKRVPGGAQPPATSQWRAGSRGKSGGRAGRGGQGGQVGQAGSTQIFASLKMSESGYRVLSAEELSEQEQLRRQVQSLLNKITPDSFGGITEKIASIPVSSGASMDTIVALVFDKAVAEHAYCEMYANMCKTLKDRWPELEFEQVEVVEDDQHQVREQVTMQKVTFVRCLIEKCQVEFDAIPATLDPTEAEVAKAGGNNEELDIIRSKKKERILGNMKFIAQLYLRNLLSTKVVKSVVDQLMQPAHGAAVEEHYIECVCMVLNNIGMYLEQHAKGAEYLDGFFGQLKCLQESGQYSKRIVYLILNLMDARRGGWRGGVSSNKLQTVVKKEEARKIPTVQSSGNLARTVGQAPPVVASRTRQVVTRPVSVTGQTSSVGGNQRGSPVGKAPVVGRLGTSSSLTQKASLASSSSSDTDEEPTLVVLQEPPVSEQQEAEVKRFRDYYADDGDLAEFLKAVAMIPSHVLAKKLFELGAEGDARKLEADARLIAELVKAEKVSIAEVESCYSQLMAEIEDVIMDVPTANKFHAHLIEELALINANSVAERLLVPAFSQAMHKTTAEKLLGEVLVVALNPPVADEALRKLLSKLMDGIKSKKVEFVAEIISGSSVRGTPAPSEGEAVRVPTFEETAIVEDALKTGEDKEGEAMKLVEIFAKCDRWALGRLEKLFESKKTAWAKTTWSERLEPVKQFVAVILAGAAEGTARSAQEKLVLLTRAMMKATFKQIDVQYMVEACLKWNVVTLSDVETFVKNAEDVDHEAERKYTEEGLTKTLADAHKPQGPPVRRR